MEGDVVQSRISEMEVWFARQSLHGWWGAGLAPVLLNISRARKVFHSVGSLDNSVFMSIFKMKTEGKKRRVFKPINRCCGLE